MLCRANCRLNNIASCYRRILKQNQFLHLFKKNCPAREICSTFENRCRDEKYGVLRNRMAAIPCLKLLEKEEGRVFNYLLDAKDESLKDYRKWCLKVFDYNRRTSNKISAANLLKAYCTYGFRIDDPTWNKWDSDGWTLAVILAWCVELHQACHVLLGDIMDQSVFRRGEPCWHTEPNVGARAISDALILLHVVYIVLQKHFAGSKNYSNIIHGFLQVKHDKVYGQLIERMFKRKSKYEQLTFKKYQTLVEYKAVNYSYCLPVHLAMHLAGGYSSKEFEFSRELCFKLALYDQIQNDHFGVFGKSDTRKIQNDIAEGKCTWFAVKFLEVASDSTKKEFCDNYGSDDKNATASVLELYRKANLFEKVEETKAQLSREISRLIESMNDIKGALFYDLLAQLQK